MHELAVFPSRDQTEQSGQCTYSEQPASLIYHRRNMVIQDDVVTLDNQLAAATEARLAHVVGETQQRSYEHAHFLEQQVKHFFGLTQEQLQISAVNIEQRIQERLDHQFQASLVNVETTVQAAIQSASSNSAASVATQVQQLNELACNEVTATATALESQVQAKLDIAIRKSEISGKIARRRLRRQTEEALKTNQAKLIDEMRGYTDNQDLSLEKKVQAMLDASHAQQIAETQDRIAKAATDVEKHVLRVQQDNFRRAEIAFYDHLQTLGAQMQEKFTESQNSNMSTIINMAEKRAEAIASKIVSTRLGEHQEILHSTAANQLQNIARIDRSTQTTHVDIPSNFPTEGKAQEIRQEPDILRTAKRKFFRNGDNVLISSPCPTKTNTVVSHHYTGM